MNWKVKGFTLIEVIIVIIAGIAVPKFIEYKDLAETRVCISNRKTVERQYSVIPQEETMDFEQFLLEGFDSICPAGGMLSYESNQIKCGLHKDISKDDEIEEPPGEEVPWV